MSIDWEHGRPVEAIVEALEEYGPELPESNGRELAEKILEVFPYDSTTNWWNTLAMANYLGFKRVVKGLVTGPRRQIIENRARTWLLEVSERYDERTLKGY